MSLKILIIDSSGTSRDFYKECLASRGHRLHYPEHSENPVTILREALAENKNYQMVLISHSEGLDLLSFVSALRQDFPELEMLIGIEPMDTPRLLALVEARVEVLMLPFTKESLQKRIGIIANRVAQRKQEQEQQQSQKSTMPMVAKSFIQIKMSNNSDKIPDTIKYILDILENQGLTDDDSFRIKLGLSEILINAIAHGNLELSSEELKGQFKNFRQWNKELETRANDPKYINRRVTIDVAFTPGYGTEIRVEDDGKGFDVNKVLKKTSDELETFNLYGRGLSMVQGTCNEVTFNEKGNVTTLKYLLQSGEQE
ncbi:MAG: ATP-binding protein [SAR324 cluster bacterium]|nr:ATP-binding protein [SAR324 cluster bacterium]